MSQSNFAPRRSTTLLAALLLTATACSRSGERFLDSGSIVISRPLPSAETPAGAGGEFAPMLGYLPTSAAFLPAENEPWLSISRTTKEVQLMVGNNKVQDFKASGSVSLASGAYALQRKDREPVWYAPDTYFERRMLQVPPPQDPIRYRRGALGSYAMFLTPESFIHSSLVCSEEVGGLKLEETELSSLFEALPLGSSVVVK